MDVYGFITVDVPYMMYMLHSLSLPLQACNISVVEVETVLVALVEVVAFFVVVMIHTLFVSFADSLSLTRGHCGLDLEVPT